MKTRILGASSVLVTGGTGFPGSCVVDELRTQSCREVSAPRSNAHDLWDNTTVVRLFEEMRPNIVIHLAAIVGGRGANRERPGEFFYDNLITVPQVMEQARLFDVDKCVAIGAVCAYPRFTPVPFRDD